MRDKTEVAKEVGRIPTHQETLDKCLDAYREAMKNLMASEGAYRMSQDDVCESYLQDLEHDIEEIRVLVGASDR